jgi:hypothetical protein
MNVTVYVPKSIEDLLKTAAGMAKITPARFIQRLVRRELEGDERSFSEGFIALAGSWEDDRTPEQIIQDIDDHRLDTRRQDLA